MAAVSGASPRRAVGTSTPSASTSTCHSRHRAANVLALGKDAVWAVDVADGMAALWINILPNHGRQLVCIPGLAVSRASAGYRGTGKTDATDATVIVDQARTRRDLTVLRTEDEQVVELRILTSRRADLVGERTRKINCLRGQLASIFPAVERALELGNLGPPILLSGYQNPAALRQIGRKRGNLAAQP
ncbi:IS110 family transposase [Streptomyces sp. NR30]|uniref:IS110 family transposase n=1 Tax=Streptomyces guryensis TaxID=2886947 RepID=A0A9Q3VYQ8_9ACTN|nr:IS110 family transposase [Streptomyces guryensis]MCD9880187.1 IS110 family transposase [Streptomyces guryensis]